MQLLKYITVWEGGMVS